MLADEATSGWMTGAQLIVDTHPSQVDNKSLARACKVVDHIRYGRYFNDTLYFILYTCCYYNMFMLLLLRTTDHNCDRIIIIYYIIIKLLLN
jgi:hypothetical protein